MADWRHKARCRPDNPYGLNPELFFVVGTGMKAAAQSEQAKAQCRLCPVVASCLAWALRTRQDDGVWGGLDPDERRDVSRRLRAQGATTADDLADFVEYVSG